MGFKLIDSHTHLDMPRLRKDIKKVIERAHNSGVTAMVTVGISLESSRSALEIAEKYSGIYCTVGLHPHGAHELSEEEIVLYKGIAESEKVVAWGEIGLDYYRDRAPRELQRLCFRQQINLARETNLPVVIHDRDAHEDTLRILKEESAHEVGGVFHCFSGDWDFAKRCLDMGFYISIPGTVTYSNAAKQRDVVRNCPLERLLVETDAPFLTPVPYRGKRNEPAYVVFTARKMAELKDLSLEEISERLTENTVRLFNLPEVELKGLSE